MRFSQLEVGKSFIVKKDKCHIVGVKIYNKPQNNTRYRNTFTTVHGKTEVIEVEEKPKKEFITCFFGGQYE